jgi:hypothetical protein
VTTALIRGDWSVIFTPRSLYPLERTTDTNWKEEWMSPEPVWRTRGKEKSCPNWDSNSDPSAIWPVSSRYPGSTELRPVTGIAKANETSVCTEARNFWTISPSDFKKGRALWCWFVGWFEPMMQVIWYQNVVNVVIYVCKYSFDTGTGFALITIFTCQEVCEDEAATS